MFKNISILILSIIGLVFVSYTTIDNKTIASNSWSKSSSLDTLLISDGPYIFIADDSLIEKRITNGLLESNALAFETLPSQFNDESSTYNNVSKIATLSDIHGQYEVTTTLLKNNKINSHHLFLYKTMLQKYLCTV